jgi:Tfp pilus assembly protein PilO
MTIPSGIRKVILPLAMLFVFGASWLGLYQPELEKIAEYKKEPAAIRQQIEQRVRQLSEYDPPTAEEREEWDILEREFSLKLPPAKQISDLYSRLSRLAVDSHCQDFNKLEIENSDTTYASGDVARRGFDIQLNFACDYRSLKDYINGLKKAGRLIEVVELDVNRNLPLLDVTMVIRSYYSP